MATASATLKRDIEFPKELSSFIDEWKDKPGSLIMILHKIQETFGYIPREAAEKLSKMADIPLARIYGVVTFYHFFKTTKPGKHRISVCLGTACYLKGGEDIIEELEGILGVGLNTVTPDGEFSVEAVRCLGCCGLAPVMVINGEVFGKVKTESLQGIVAKFRKG